MSRPTSEPRAKRTISPSLSRAMRRASPAVWWVVGPVVRGLGRTASGRAVLRASGMLVGNVVGGVLARSRRARDARDVAAPWIELLHALACRHEVAVFEPGRVELHMLACPVGLGPREGRQACLAGMRADRVVVRRLGGRLVIGETIGSGAGLCHLTVLYQGSGEPSRTC